MRPPINTLEALNRRHSRYTREAAELILDAAVGVGDNQALRKTVGAEEIIFLFNCAVWKQACKELWPLN